MSYRIIITGHLADKDEELAAVEEARKLGMGVPGVQTATFEGSYGKYDLRSAKAYSRAKDGGAANRSEEEPADDGGEKEPVQAAVGSSQKRQRGG